MGPVRMEVVDFTVFPIFNNMNKLRKRVWGFTLIEVLVASTIIAVLIAIGAVSYSSINRRSRDTKRRSDLEQMRSALEQYRADNGFYPNTGSGWVIVNDTNMGNLIAGGYMAKTPADPKASTQSYWYQATNPVGTGPVNYYGYCLTAYLEATSVNDDSCPGGGNSANQPLGTAIYAVRHP